MNAQHKSSLYKFVGGRGGQKQVWPPKFKLGGWGHGPSHDPPLFMAADTCMHSMPIFVFVYHAYFVCVCVNFFVNKIC